MQNNRLSKNNKGVTLVEVIAVIAVLGVVMAAVTGFMITGTKMSAKVSNEAGSSMREQTAVEFINRRLWEAKNIEFELADKDTGDITSILIDGVNLSYNEDANAVYYGATAEKEGVKLCEGKIRFEKYVVGESVVEDVIVYYIEDNGDETMHIVHLRITAS